MNDRKRFSEESVVGERNNPQGNRAAGPARRPLLLLGLLLSLTLLPASEARVASPVGKKVAAGTRNALVTISAVNMNEGMVTAKDTAGITFEFPANPATVKKLKVGAQVNSQFIQQAVSLSGAKRPHCPCGQRPSDGKCWCSKCLGDPCFKFGCPYGDCRSRKTGDDKPIVISPNTTNE